MKSRVLVSSAINRRRFLRNSIAATSAALTGVYLGFDVHRVWALPAESEELPPFPHGFLFGAASSCVQVEGASRADGKGESTWDRFARIPGNIKDGSTPDVACDSYNRWRDDIALLKRMGMNSYRFSIAWPRILPEGRGRRNEKGLDHYDRVIDALLEAGVDPLVTCFHWDLPATLEDEGGWANREIAHSFADYCELLAERYGDRVRRWCLLNEPQAFTVVGFGWGVFPPGKRDQTLMLRATHTANLALAQGFRAMKAQEAKLQLGFAQDFSLGYPLTGSNADQAAWKRYDAFRNRWFLDPNVTGQYPECFIGGVPLEQMNWRAGDETILKVPLDYTGVNFYCEGQFFAAGEAQSLLHGLDAHAVDARHDTPRHGMREVMLRMAHDYKRPIEITETGFESLDVPDALGRVHDPGRIAYMHMVLSESRRAMLDGADIRALHIWSLLDDWEWNEGLTTRIGLVYVDFKNNQKRTLKDSGDWYGNVARTSRIPALS
ncbi:MAG: glycoside hydrolase family 1 protein [Terracidiphilus sp.]